MTWFARLSLSAIMLASFLANQLVPDDRVLVRRREGLLHVNDPLIAGSSKLQGQVLQVVHKTAIDQNIDVVQHLQLVRRLLEQLLPGVARPGPDVLVMAEFLSDPVDDPVADPGVQEWLSAQQGQPLHVRLADVVDDLVFQFLGVRAAVVKILGV